MRGAGGTLPLLVFMGAAACAVPTVGGGAWLADLLERC